MIQCDICGAIVEGVTHVEHGGHQDAWACTTCYDTLEMEWRKTRGTPFFLLGHTSSALPPIPPTAQEQSPFDPA